MALEPTKHVNGRMWQPGRARRMCAATLAARCVWAFAHTASRRCRNRPRPRLVSALHIFGGGSGQRASLSRMEEYSEERLLSVGHPSNRVIPNK
jgi:hypothetical protein